MTEAVLISEVSAPAGKRERAKAANRQAILDAARRVFLQLGYEAATVRDIIRGTELASGTFYNYFKSKEEVFDALADDGVRRFRPILRQIRDEATALDVFIARAVRAYFDFLVEEHRTGAMPLAPRGPHVCANTPEMIAVYEEIRAGIAASVAQGFAPPVDPDFFAASCVGVSQEVGLMMLRRDPPDVDAAARYVTAFLLGGVHQAAAEG